MGEDKGEPRKNHEGEALARNRSRITVMTPASKNNNNRYPGTWVSAIQQVREEGKTESGKEEERAVTVLVERGGHKQN